LRRFNNFLTTELKPKCGNGIGTYSLDFSAKNGELANKESQGPFSS
jgi:hypothetical protein